MAGPGASNNSIRQPEIDPATLKPERSIMKRNHIAQEKEVTTSQGQRAARCTCERRPAVPKRSDPPPVQYPPYKDNYVEYNAKHISDFANYREPRFQVVDSRNGHVMDAIKSGLIPVYKEKQNYGRLPGYLKKCNQSLNRDQEKNEEVSRDATQSQTEVNPMKSASKQPTRPRVSKEIEALQKRWIELEERLRLISFSRPDKREAIEDELRSIEVRLRMAIPR